LAAALCASAAIAANDLQSTAGSAARVPARQRQLIVRADAQFVIAYKPAVRQATNRRAAAHAAAVAATGTRRAARWDGPLRLRAALTRTVRGKVAKILHDGFAAAPASAPLAVQQAIWAGNQLIGRPYWYGGGHGTFISDGYDCSGSVSFALHGGNLLSAPIDSLQMMDWGEGGHGHWMTVYTNPGHAFLEIAGIRLDTSTAGDPDGLSGPRWRPLLADTAGFVQRHPADY
jgi:cell wall-associated NlpC family hydrolase